MSSEKRKRGEVNVEFIPEELESSRVAFLREDKILGRIKREDVTDLAYQGPDLPDGSVNFDCSCTGSLPFGPCGEMYRNAIRCMKTYEHLGMTLTFIRFFICYIFSLRAAFYYNTETWCGYNTKYLKLERE